MLIHQATIAPGDQLTVGEVHRPVVPQMRDSPTEQIA
jgi:hypothetical protein